MNHTDININDVIKGRDEAWRDVYTVFWSKLVYYIMRKNRFELCQDDAEEIVQEAMMKVYQHRLVIESTKHLSNLLYKVVANVAITKFRESKKNIRIVKLEYLKIIDDTFDLIGDDPLIDDLDLDRVATEVMAYIASLPPKYMEIARQKIDEYGSRTPQHSNKFYIDLHRLRTKLNRKFHIS